MVIKISLDELICIIICSLTYIELLVVQITRSFSSQPVNSSLLPFAAHNLFLPRDEARPASPVTRPLTVIPPSGPVQPAARSHQYILSSNSGCKFITSGYIMQRRKTSDTVTDLQPTPTSFNSLGMSQGLSTAASSQSPKIMQYIPILKQHWSHKHEKTNNYILNHRVPSCTRTITPWKSCSSSVGLCKSWLVKYIIRNRMTHACYLYYIMYSMSMMQLNIPIQNMTYV